MSEYDSDAQNFAERIVADAPDDMLTAVMGCLRAAAAIGLAGHIGYPALCKDLADAIVDMTAERDQFAARVAEMTETVEAAEETLDDEEAAHQDTLRLLELRTQERDAALARVADLEKTCGEWWAACSGIPAASPHTLRTALREAGEKILALRARVAELDGKLAKSERYSEHTTQWYAVRIERIKDVAKVAGIWPQIAAILANGTVSSDDPVNYARLLNQAKHEAKRANERAEAAEAERDRLAARVAELEAQVIALEETSMEMAADIEALEWEGVEDLVAVGAADDGVSE